MKKELVFFGGFGLILYGLLSFLKGVIWVGSRSYHGRTFKIVKQEEPLRFYFWCSFFVLGGLSVLLLNFYG
ncbi:MAG: hypothetical protein CL678_04505 [Bdellovibrionaceae bacterium]|nr:hypothetical protein [Pseudobdellovibrionaceae bacterium]|tara:strand:- start:2527 stop:2739 length:213 start_codon:yes stop_codon:yes gene_type:complete